MPFDRPTLDELRERVKGDIASRLPGTDPLLRWNNLGIIGEVEAGTAHLLYGRIYWSFLQLFPDTAEGPFLEQWASIWGVKRIEATAASGPAAWAALASTAIPTGSIAMRGDGTQYTVSAGASVGDDGFVRVAVTALVPGAEGNAEPGVQLTLSTTATGVTPLGAVSDPGLAGGAPRETDAELLMRLLARMQNPPHGGTASDYVLWAFEVPGVTRAWCYPTENGPGTVVVRFMMDDVRADAQGIPTAGDVATVQAHLDTRRPITAQVTAVAPTPNPMAVHITQLDADTPEIRDTIYQELQDMMRGYAVPGEVLFINRVFAAINAAPGVVSFHLIAPTGDFASPAGQIAVLGAVAYG